MSRPDDLQSILPVSPVKDYSRQSGYEETALYEHGISVKMTENIPENASPLNLSEVYLMLGNTSASADKRLELFEVLKDELRQGNVTLSNLAAYHVHFCIDQVLRFNIRPGIGLLEHNEKLLVPALTFLREGLMMGDKNLLALTLKSQLLPYLAKLVLTFAERIDLMTKNLSKLCSVETVLGVSNVIHPSEHLQSLLDVPKIPDCFLATNICKAVEMQHHYECQCMDCKELVDRPPTPVNPYQLQTGVLGTLMYPVRSLPKHKAAICPLPQYWECMESRSQKIGFDIAHLVQRGQMKDRGRGYEYGHRGRLNRMFAPGQQVAVPTECLSFVSGESSSSADRKLPTYIRGFVIGECPLPIGNPYIGVWIPDYAATGLCLPEKLMVLPEFSCARTYAPLIYIGAACPPTPLEVLNIAIELIHLLLLNNANLESVKCLLEDKGPWKCVQLIRFISGDAKVKLLSITNKLTKDFERGSRSVVACCLHNTLADWIVWKVYTQTIPQFEQETLLEGLIQSIPRIDARKWPKRSLLLQSLHALMRDCPAGNLLTMLKTCKEMLAWDSNNTGSFNRFSRPMSRGGRPWQSNHPMVRNVDSHQEHQHSKFGADRNVVNSKDQENDSDQGEEPVEGPRQYSVGRKPRSGETWYQCKSATLSMRNPDSINEADCAALIQASVPSMIRGLLYKGAEQGQSCEILEVTSLRDVRQPMLARIICGMLNGGGGRIFIGLGDHSLVQGVHASRPERDSFTQGVLDVATYSLEPRLMPFTFQVERRVVLKAREHVPDGEWNRFVFVIHVRPPLNTVYQVLPEKQSFIRRNDGSTVYYAAGVKRNSLQSEEN